MRSLWLAAGVLVACAGPPAEPIKTAPPSIAAPASASCGLSWEHVGASFADWQATYYAPADVDGDGRNDYAVFGHQRDDLVAVLIAEIGGLRSQFWGAIRYCLVRDGSGRVLEEVGTNPLKRIPEPEGRITL